MAPLRFLILRIARIYPGSLVCLSISVLIMGPVLTDLSTMEYFRPLDMHCYIRDNLSFTNLFPADMPKCMTLPGVFASNHYGPGVNGSLWTLTPELACYAYMLVLGVMGLLRSTFHITATILSILLLHYFEPSFVPYFSDDHYTDILKVFMAEVLAYAYRDLISIRFRFLLPLVIMAAFLQNTLIEEYVL